MKIVLISQNASPGLIIFRKSLIRSLAENGHEVYCFATEFNEETRHGIRKLGGLPVGYSLSRTGLNPFRDLWDTWVLSRKLKLIQPDLVLTFFSKPVIYGAFASKLAKVPKCIGMLEGLGFAFTEQPFPLPLKTRVIRWVQVLLYRLAIPLLDKIIFLNSDDPKDLIERYSINAKKIDVLGGIGIELSEYAYVKPNSSKHRFIFVGRLLAEKGVLEYISAAKSVKSKYPSVEFVMLGGLDEGNPGGLTRRELEQLKLDNIIIHPGHVSDVHKWISESTVFVLPSYYREGVPRSTQEAMAIGRAVITTDVPGCRDTVKNGLNGFVVPKWNAEALAEAMMKFIEDPSLVELMGFNSFQIAQNEFDVVAVNKKLMDMLGVS